MTMSSVTKTFEGGRPPAELSFGVGLRRPHFDGILDNHAGVDFLEILSENYMAFGGRPRRVLRAAAERLPIVMHGVSLNIGGLDPLNPDYLERLGRLIRELKPPWFSDHLSYSAHGGVEYNDLIPLPFTEEAVVHVVERIKQVQAIADVPFLLENPSYYVVMPGAEMSEAEFVCEVVRRADCGLLLDVNNVHVNAVNHGYDARAFIDAMPASRVLQYHISGHDSSGDFIIDTHGSRIIDQVYDLYRYALRRIGVAWTLLEWDNNIPSLELLLRENDNVRRAAAEVLPATARRGQASAGEGEHVAASA
jgi:uncharacterized protein (UPF0276 family)